MFGDGTLQTPMKNWVWGGGPYLIVDKISDLTYKIQKTPQTEPISVHIGHLTPYLCSKVPSGWENQSQVFLIQQPPISTPQQSQIRSRVGRLIKQKKIFSPS